MLSRREFLGFLGGLAAAASSPWSEDRASLASPNAWSLEDFVQNIQHGGPPKDGIPPIEHPKYLTAGEAQRFLKPDDIVFGLDYRGVVKAYPQKILVWHEIVNEEIEGRKFSVTYCPLTGSAVGFWGRSRTNGEWLTFGTSGKLVNSNLLMYDRQTDSEWPQILGVAISGPNKGLVLDQIPLAWTSWVFWRRRYPNTLVLSTKTGYFRTYGRDPYGSYERSGTYYDSGGPFFPVMAEDNRFPSKKVVIGIEVAGQKLTIPKDHLRAKNVANVNLSGVPLAAFYDSDLDIVRVHARSAGAKVLTFRWGNNGRIVDETTGSTWTAEGRAEEGKLAGTQLKQIPSFDVMWFAWKAFFPETVVVG